MQSAFRAYSPRNVLNAHIANNKRIMKSLWRSLFDASFVIRLARLGSGQRLSFVIGGMKARSAEAIEAKPAPVST